MVFKNKAIINKIRPLVEDYLDDRMEKREITEWQVNFSEDVLINPTNNSLLVKVKLTPRSMVNPITMVIKVFSSGKLI